MRAGRGRAVPAAPLGPRYRGGLGGRAGSLPALAGGSKVSQGLRDLPLWPLPAAGSLGPGREVRGAGEGAGSGTGPRGSVWGGARCRRGCPAEHSLALLPAACPCVSRFLLG